MARSRPRKKPEQTWSGLDEDDLTGQAEAEDAQLIEFGRRAQDPPKPSEQKEPRCRKRKR
jgi:hypothetical protein